MTILLPTLAVAFAAFCVWLTVRIVNRRERWAKRLALGLVVALLVYTSAYASMVRPLRGLWEQGAGCIPVYVAPGTRDFSRGSFWLPGQKIWVTFFSPAHWIDMQIRRETWKFTPI